MPLVFNTVSPVQHLRGSGRPSLPSCPSPPVVPLGPRGSPRGPAAAPSPRRAGDRGAAAPQAARLCRGVPFLRPLLASQVLQGGGLESPTKPKGRPKKNSIPSSEQLSEQERARDAEKPPESLGSPAEVSQEE